MLVTFYTAEYLSRDITMRLAIFPSCIGPKKTGVLIQRNLPSSSPTLSPVTNTMLRL